MGLPTNLPGGDNSPSASPNRRPPQKPQANPQPESTPQKRKRTIADLTPEERQILIQRRAAKKAAEEARAKAAQASQKAPIQNRAPKPKNSNIVPPRNDSSSDDSRSHLETKIDPKTGKEYKALPKVVANGDGFSDLPVDDFDLADLSKEADTFMAHLRVPPNRAEMEELRMKKQVLAKKQKEDYVEEAKRIAQIERDDENTEDENDAKSKGFFRKLFNK